MLDAEPAIPCGTASALSSQNVTTTPANTITRASSNGFIKFSFESEFPRFIEKIAVQGNDFRLRRRI
jgi:hypothetical protein